MTAPATDDIAALPEALSGDFPPASLEKWRQLIDKALKGADFDTRLVARTADGIRIEPLFVARPVGAGAPVASRRTDGARWDILQLHAGADPDEANAAILEDLAGGATSITLQIGAPGWGGLPYHEADISRTLQGVLLDVCPVALKAGEYTPDAAGSLIAVWTARGIDAGQRLGAFNYDPLGTLAETGGLYQPLATALGIAGDLVRQTVAWPGVTALRADGHVWHAAGASEAQELAAVVSAIVAYLRAAETVGIAPVQALPKIAVTLAVDADQLMGLAKLRAARQLIGRIAEACGATAAASHVLIGAETSRAMMTRRDPWVNMLRTTMACAVAAWGGADSITVLPFSWALGQPDALARRMARNTSIVLMEESGLGRVADPAAGSFAIETLTAELARAAWGEFQALEAGGGLGAALCEGRWQQAIERRANAKRAGVATGKIPLTGTSVFPKLGDDGVGAPPWPLAETRAADLNGVRVAALVPYRPAAPFEALRDAADAFATRTGAPPRVFLACLGPLASHAARATWTTNFLAAGGIAVTQSAALLTSADAGRAFGESGATVACLCGADDIYAELGEAAASLLKTAGAQRVFVAGRLKAHDAPLKAAGVDAFVFAGCDMLEALGACQAALGVGPRDA